MRFDKLSIELLDIFCRFVLGASMGLLGMILVDQLLCPGIFLTHDRLLLGWALLTGAISIVFLSGDYDA